MNIWHICCGCVSLKRTAVAFFSNQWVYRCATSHYVRLIWIAAHSFKMGTYPLSCRWFGLLPLACNTLSSVDLHNEQIAVQLLFIGMADFSNTLASVALLNKQQIAASVDLHNVHIAVQLPLIWMAASTYLSHSHRCTAGFSSCIDLCWKII